jgi:hypothetical protein
MVPITKKTDRHDITEILLKVALNTINQTKPSVSIMSIIPNGEKEEAKLNVYYIFLSTFGDKSVSQK